MAENYPISAAICSMDLSIEAEALGADIKYSEDDIPTVHGRLIVCADDVAKLSGYLKQGRTAVLPEACKRAKQVLGDKAVFGGAIGAFSLAGRLMDMTEIMIACYEEPETVHALLDKCTGFLIDYIGEFKANNADGVLIAEPAAGLLSPALCEEFSSHYIKKIVDAVQDENFVVVYHNCGNVVPLYKSLADIGADIYHFGNAIDIEKMLRLMPQDKIIMGNIDPVLFKDGTSEQIKNEVNSLLCRCGGYPNFVISTGCDVPAKAKWENIEAYFGAVTDFYNSHP